LALQSLTAYCGVCVCRTYQVTFFTIALYDPAHNVVSLPCVQLQMWFGSVLDAGTNVPLPGQCGTVCILFGVLSGFGIVIPGLIFASIFAHRYVRVLCSAAVRIAIAWTSMFARVVDWTLAFPSFFTPPSLSLLLLLLPSL
jgi:hypothetical protein